MSWLLKILLLTVVCVTTPSLASDALSPEQLHTILEQGHTAFAEGSAMRDTNPDAAHTHFLRAADRWSLLVQDGVINGPLLYDLGNAWVQAGDLGQGIAAYLRAEQYMPGDPRLAENLAHARSLVSPQFAPDSTQALFGRLTGWHDGWSISTRLLLFAIGWVGFWTVLILGNLMTAAIPRWVGGLTSIVAVVFGISVTLTLFGDTGAVGVLIQDDVMVRKGNADSYTPQFVAPINGGVEFRILESQPVWLHVEFQNGEDGWIPRDAAEFVVLPIEAAESQVWQQANASHAQP
ncbi:MAG: hypothetical protein P8I91_08080 [Phycisphaerales bacterium]|nr:hypothetical protein [Phycisphaerales bacterium]